MRPDRFAHLRSPAWWTRLVLATGLVLGSGALFLTHFRIGLNISSCVPQRWFLVGQGTPGELAKGRFYAFESRGAEPHFPDGTMMLKLLVAAPGDHVRVSNGEVLINGDYYGDLRYAERAPRFVERDEIVPDGHFWFMGTLPESFDSRYWGYVTADQIRSSAWALF